MRDTPEISVVSAMYNNGRYVGDAIRSLQKQSLDSWELLLVDDASQDDSVEVASALARDDARIRIIRRDSNGGPAAARNLGLAAARGRWIAILDGDDLMSAQRLHVLMQRALTDRAAIVTDNLLVFSDRTYAAKPFLPTRFAARPRWIGLAEFIDSNRFNSRVPNLGYLKPLLNAGVLRRSGLIYDERLRVGEDYDLLARLLVKGHKLRLEPAALYWYRRHPESTSYRIHGEELRALIAADARLALELPGCAKRERAALRRRRQSLEMMLVYDDFVRLVKAGRYASAASRGMLTPKLWPLLTETLTDRLKRFHSPA